MQSTQNRSPVPMARALLIHRRWLAFRAVFSSTSARQITAPGGATTRPSSCGPAGGRSLDRWTASGDHLFRDHAAPPAGRSGACQVARLVSGPLQARMELGSQPVSGRSVPRYPALPTIHPPRFLRIASARAACCRIGSVQHRHWEFEEALRLGLLDRSAPRARFRLGDHPGHSCAFSAFS